MNRAKDINCFSIFFWETIYESGEQIRIEHLIKSLYEVEDWKELHIALWSWLSLDGKRQKREWFEAFSVPKVKQDCFACEQAEMAFCCCPTKSEEEGKPSFCYYCPITASEAEECLDGLYGKWALEIWVGKLEEREELARYIANLEWTIK